LRAVYPARLMLLPLITLIGGLFGEELQNCIFCFVFFLYGRETPSLVVMKERVLS